MALDNITELGPFGGSELDEKTITAVYSAETSSTSGTVPAPTGGTLIEDHFASGVDAYCSTVTTGFAPDKEVPTESDGTPVVVSSFVAATGAFTLSGTPSSFPVAIVFAASGTLASLDITDALEAYDLDGASVLDGYTEVAASITFTSGAASLNLSTAKNIETTTLTEDSVLTITNLTAYKALTIAVTQTAGPWTLGLAYGAKTISATMNGAAGEALETVEVWCDGTDLFVPTDGGVLWTVGV